MAGHRIARFAIAVLAAWAASRAAIAQPVKDPKVARKWLATGQTMMQRGAYFASRHRPDDAKQQFESAVSAYHNAIDASDDVNLYLELALAEDKAGKLDAAVRHLRRLVQADAGARADVVRRATAKLEQVLARVGLVTLTVAPPGTSITLGGAELGLSPLAEPLVLSPGTYTLAFQADGFQPREAELKVEAGSESERAIELERVRVIVEPVKPAPVEEPPRALKRRSGEDMEDRAERGALEPSRPSRLPLYAGAAVTVAAAGGAGVIGALAIREHTLFTRPSTSPAAREDARASGRLFAELTDAAVITAAVAAGFTAYWYFYRYRPRLTYLAADRGAKPSDSRRGRHSSPIRTKLEVVPWVQSQRGGMAIAGWF